MDIARYAARRRAIAEVTNSELAYEAFYSYLLPQFEGITDEAADALVDTLGPMLSPTEQAELKNALVAVLGVELSGASTDAADVDDEVD
jgi:hypothetical protein